MARKISSSYQNIHDFFILAAETGIFDFAEAPYGDVFAFINKFHPNLVIQVGRCDEAFIGALYDLASIAMELQISEDISEDKETRIHQYGNRNATKDGAHDAKHDLGYRNMYNEGSASFKMYEAGYNAMKKLIERQGA